MANSRARTQLKGSADYSAPILKAHRLETRTQHLLLINLRERRNRNGSLFFDLPNQFSKKWQGIEQIMHIVL